VLRRPLALALACLIALLAAPAAAHAVWFPAEPLDGPSAAILGSGGAGVAPDGGGAVVWRRTDGVFLSRLVAGSFQTPVRIDAGTGAGASEAAVTAGDGGRLAVVWIAGNRLYGAQAPSARAPAPLSAPVLLFESPTGALDGLDVDIGVNGTAYAVFRAPGTGGGDVRAVRLLGATWEGLAAPLDIDPARPAGVGTGRPRVAVAADGNAVVAWGEAGAVYGRRLTGLALSLAPQPISFPGEGTADAPAVSIEHDGSFAWVAFRQEVSGTPRAFGRRLIGSLYEPAVLLDAGYAAGAPDVALNGRGQGVAAVPTAGGAIGQYVGTDDLFEPPARLDGGGATETGVVASDLREVAVVWRGPAGDVLARFKRERQPWEAIWGLSRPELGVVAPGSLRLGGDRRSDVVAAMVQGEGAATRLVAAVYDRPPSPPFLPERTRFQRTSRPRLSWSPGIELWGVSYTVAIDGKVVGSTDAPRLRVPAPLREGAHKVVISAVDRRGQATPGRERVLRVDGTPPRVRVAVTGARRAGAALRIRVRATDRGAGIRSYRIDFGDGAAVARGARGTHRYRRGRFTLRAAVTDRAGNTGSARLRLTIR